MADLLPALSTNMGIDAAIGDDLDILIGEQQIDQNAVVLCGVPDPQMRENIERAPSRWLVANRGRDGRPPIRRCTEREALG